MIEIKRLNHFPNALYIDGKPLPKQVIGTNPKVHKDYISARTLIIEKDMDWELIPYQIKDPKIIEPYIPIEAPGIIEYYFDKKYYKKRNLFALVSDYVFALFHWVKYKGSLIYYRYKYRHI